MFGIGQVGCDEDTALYGDQTAMSDLSYYRDQIIAFVRPECSDGVDNDADLLIDLADPDCLDAEDDSEAPPVPMLTPLALGLVFGALVLAAGLRLRSSR